MQSRSGKPLGTLTVPNDADVPTLKAAYAKQTPSMYVDRQRFYLPAVGGAKPVALGDRATLAAAGLTDGGTVVLKDLGPQISWKAVFVLEYLGPLLIFPAFLFGQEAIYGRVTPPGSVAAEHQVALALAWALHYAKREFETLCVHRFSHATMPLGNLAKNCGYYWGFAAAVASTVAASAAVRTWVLVPAPCGISSGEGPPATPPFQHAFIAGGSARLLPLIVVL